MPDPADPTQPIDPAEPEVTLPDRPATEPTAPQLLGAPAGPVAPTAPSVPSLAPAPSPAPAPPSPPEPPLPPAPVPPAPERAAAPRREGRTLRHVLVGAIAGGVVGAIVAAGAVTVLDDDSPSTVSAPAASDVIVRPSQGIDREGDIAAILQQTVPAVVAIVDDGGPGNGGAAGTGFVLSADGVIVTNNHVVEGADKIQAHFSDGTKLSAKVLGTAPSSDLAVLKVDGADLATMDLGDSDAVQVGDDVVAIGNALALEGGLTVTRGIVSGLHRDLPTGDGGSLGDVIQTDAAINPGNSGGPLVDAKGRVIGINTAIADPQSAQNVGFAIPISQVKSLISELQEGRRPALLGVSTNPDQSEQDGAVVEDVSPGSPAADAGLKAGDVVKQVGKTPVHTNGGLRPAIRRYKAGEEVDVVVERDGRTLTLHVKLGEASEAES